MSRFCIHIVISAIIGYVLVHGDGYWTYLRQQPDGACLANADDTWESVPSLGECVPKCFSSHPLCQGLSYDQHSGVCSTSRQSAVDPCGSRSSFITTYIQDESQFGEVQEPNISMFISTTPPTTTTASSTTTTASSTRTTTSSTTTTTPTTTTTTPPTTTIASSTTITTSSTTTTTPTTTTTASSTTTTTLSTAASMKTTLSFNPAATESFSQPVGSRLLDGLRIEGTSEIESGDGSFWIDDDPGTIACLHPTDNAYIHIKWSGLVYLSEVRIWGGANYGQDLAGISIIQDRSVGHFRYTFHSAIDEPVYSNPVIYTNAEPNFEARYLHISWEYSGALEFGGFCIADIQIYQQ